MEHKILLPTIAFLDKFDTMMMLGGGILLGIVLILLKDRFDKWAGISMIIINLVTGTYLLAKALV